jgi:glycosyltransferase involved in cell wall biosynthesis
MKWIILIPTLPERAAKLKRLTNLLDQQLVEGVTYKINDAGRSTPTGTKRNMLIEATQSEYFSFIDDDDKVSNDYVKQIMTALEAGPDVVTFNGFMTTNGGDRRNFTIKLGSRYEEVNKHYYRFPNHLSVFRRDKVQHIKFPPVWQQEDFAWAKTIHDRRLLKSEIHIHADLYHYDFITTKPSYAKR